MICFSLKNILSTLVFTSMATAPFVYAGVPVVTAFSPSSGAVGTSVAITGTNFDVLPANNIVYFGAVRANVVSASPTNLLLTVPTGATYAPITVTVNGLTALSSKPFLPTFSGVSAIDSSSLAPRVDIGTGNGPLKVVAGDLDGDGRPDLVEINYYDGTVAVYRNLCTNGSLAADSFESPVVLSIPGAANSLFGLALADLDGDGRLDIVTGDFDLNQISIFQNVSSPGSLTTGSFAARVGIPVAGTPGAVAIVDLDGDGKPEIITANHGGSSVSVLRNIGTGGIIDTNFFASPVNFSVGASPFNVVAVDVDGDGKPDVVTVNQGDINQKVSILRNTSMVGDVSGGSLAPAMDLAGSDAGETITVGDLDGDGKPDLIVGSWSGQTIAVYRNLSTSGSVTTNSFAPEVAFSAGGNVHTIAVGDLDGDGKPDLAVVTELPSQLSLFKNTSIPGSFTISSLGSRIDFASGYNAVGVVFDDLNGDGRPDVVFGNFYSGTFSVYPNNVPAPGPPVITDQPASQTVAEAGSASFAVAVRGGGPYSYQWTFNGTNIDGAMNDLLTLTNLHPWQSGSYYVKLTTPYGTNTSSAAMLTVVAEDILAYRFAGTTKFTTLGERLSYAYSGLLLFIPDHTNGTFVGWSVIKGKKQYWISQLPDYLLITVPGSGKQTFTILGRAGQGIDENGQQHLWADLHKGQNTLLKIGKGKSHLFPNTFSSASTHVYPSTQTGNMVLNESACTYVFAPQITRTANNTGQTTTDLVKDVIKSLEAQGYHKQ